MKKLFFLTVFLFWGFTEISAQCTSCSGTINTGNTSSAIGKNTVSTGLTSFASGFGSQATEGYTTALGFYSFATYNKATAIGSTVKSSGYQSIVLGSGDYNTGTYLINNIPRSLMIGFHSLYPTLFVVGDDTPNVFNKTGRIGIGNVTNPLAKLHIRADEGEEAAVFIEPHSWGGGNKAGVYLGNFHNSVFADSSSGIVYKTENNHVFTGGDVYIKDIEKGIIMKSPDGKCWRGTLDNNGSLNFVQLDACPEDTATNRIPEKTGSSGQLNIYPNPTSDYLNVEVKNNTHKPLTVSLSDNNGILIAKQYIRSGKTKFYTGNIPSGVYYVRVQGKGVNMVKKVVRANN